MSTLFFTFMMDDYQCTICLHADVTNSVNDGSDIRMIFVMGMISYERVKGNYVNVMLLNLISNPTKFSIIAKVYGGS